jgi:hypothetical protein
MHINVSILFIFLVFLGLPRRAKPRAVARYEATEIKAWAEMWFIPVRYTPPKSCISSLNGGFTKGAQVWAAPKHVVVIFDFTTMLAIWCFC